MKIPLPYHKSFLELDIPDAALLGVLEPDQNSVSVPEFGSDPVKNLEIQREIIEKALSSWENNTWGRNQRRRPRGGATAT